MKAITIVFLIKNLKPIHTFHLITLIYTLKKVVFKNCLSFYINKVIFWQYPSSNMQRVQQTFHSAAVSQILFGIFQKRQVQLITNESLPIISNYINPFNSWTFSFSLFVFDVKWLDVEDNDWSCLKKETGLE